MSVFGDVMSEAIQPALMGLLGDSILRYPAGNANQPVRIDAIWTEDDPRRVLRQGDKSVRKGLLKIHESVASQLSDKWLVESVVWSVESNEKIEGGFRHVRLTREERQQTKPKMQG